ncbi:hypothetical protein [Fundicoccus culcitae]|uniref:Uncharacterized protein n=1 Tax=Fundicoccus culcitae TaxID=2969821 RepID=A0ABY5P521_9LACT|nr:hypothetical protein [Fundicoccus culcitae]UUX33792.1 hypothetical protein NRE15_13015 [Fundicoccus culcitae]
MHQLFSILIYSFIIAYAVLTLIAAFMDIRLNGFFYWHVFYFIAAIGLLIALLPNIPNWGLPLALGLLVVVAILNGYLTNSLQWSHIAIRTIISLIVAYGWMLLK